MMIKKESLLNDKITSTVIFIIFILTFYHYNNVLNGNLKKTKIKLFIEYQQIGLPNSIPSSFYQFSTLRVRNSIAYKITFSGITNIVCYPNRVVVYYFGNAIEKVYLKDSSVEAVDLKVHCYGEYYKPNAIKIIPSNDDTK